MANAEDRLAMIEAASERVRPPTEKSIQIKSRDALNKMPRTVCHRYQGDQGGIKGHSDLYGVCCGRAFYIEIKRPDKTKTLTKIQADFLRKMRDVGGAIVGVATSPQECKDILIGNIAWEE